MKNILSTIFAILTIGILAQAQPGDLLSATAKAAFEKQNFAPCIAEMSKLILTKPKNDAALVERARCLYLSADNSSDAKLILAEISKKIPDAAKARAATEIEISSRQNRANADVNKAIAINPKNAAAFNLRGLINQKLSFKDRRDTIVDFDRAIELDPKFLKPYFNRGVRKAEMNDHDGAIADFTKVIALDPNNIAAMEFRVISMIGKSDGKPNLEAFNELQKIIKLAPANEYNYFLAGVECFNFTNKYECVDLFQRYTTAFPRSYDAFMGLARANASVEFYHNLINRITYWKNAELAYDKANQIKPKDIEPYTELFELRLEKFRDHKNAEALSREAIINFPQDPQSYIMAGRVALKLQKFDKAVADLTRAIELNAGNSAAYSYRGDAYRELNNLDRSLADLNKAVELDAFNGKAFMHRGNLFVVQKKYQEAIAAFTEADRLNETCAKTYRGVVYGTIALENKEQGQTGNIIRSNNDFLADDAQKCYDTHFQFGTFLYAQGRDKEAAERFNSALTVYKTYSFNTDEIVEWQAKLKTAVANSQPTPVSQGSVMANTIRDHRARAVAAGHTILGSGVYNAVETLEFNVKRGETYIVIAMIEGYSPLIFDLFSSPGSEFLKPTHKWEDTAYAIDSSANYAMRSQVLKAENHSMLQINFMITSRSSIQKIRFFPNKEKGKPLHWIFYRLK